MPSLFPLPRQPLVDQYSDAGRLIERAEVDRDEVFWKGGAFVFEYFSLDRGEFEYGWRLEDWDPDRCGESQVWSIRDHPELALEFAMLPCELDGSVRQSAIESFVSTYGPVTPSCIIGPVLTDPDLLLAGAAFSGAFAHRADPRAGDWYCNVSRARLLVQSVVDELASESGDAIAASLRAIDRTPRATLLRALLIQLLELATAKLRPRSCAGCGRLFVWTDGPSEAHHRGGHKRRDAKYHSAACRKRTLERARRSRQKQSTKIVGESALAPDRKPGGFAESG